MPSYLFQPSCPPEKKSSVLSNRLQSQEKRNHDSSEDSEIHLNAQPTDPGFSNAFSQPPGVGEQCSMWAPSPPYEAAITQDNSTRPQTASADRLDVDERMRFRHKPTRHSSRNPLLTQTKHNLNNRRSMTAETQHNLNRQRRGARVVWYYTTHGPPPPFPLPPFRYPRRDALKMFERPRQAEKWAPPIKHTHALLPTSLSPTAQVPLVGGQQGHGEGGRLNHNPTR